ncbi:ATP-grasp domain-containing protein [Niallia sp. 03133]|uniref:ATP-grasp domain-containing protein n=1 Tax=Niallia sp. 03133 TaxID=3458060 RepID=UPI004044DFA2
MDKKHLLMLELNRGPTGIEYLKAAKRLGLFVTLVSFKPNHFLKMEKQLDSHMLQYIDNILTIDTHQNHEGLVEKVLKYNEIFPIDGVLSTYDLEMYQGALLANSLHVIGTNPSAIATARSKYLTREVLNKKMIKVPKYKLIETMDEAIEFAGEIGYPCILKPVDGQGSDNVHFIKKEEDFYPPIKNHQENPIYYRGVRKFPKLLVEEYLDGPLVSVETVSFKGEIYVLGITDRTLCESPYFIAKTASFPAKIAKQDEVIESVVEALRAIDYNFGPAHTEVIITSEGPRIVEINPRLAGGSISLMMNWVFGKSIHEEIIKMHVGMPFSYDFEVKGVGAYLRIFSQKTGVLQGIEGTESALNTDGIKDFYMEHEFGNHVTNNPKGLADGIGVLSGISDSNETIMNSLEEASKKIKVVVK